MKLPNLYDPKKALSILALDQVALLAESLGLSLKEPSHEQFLKQVLGHLLTVLSPEASAVILDPRYGLACLDKKDPQANMLIRLEQLVQPDPLVPPKLFENWGVEDTKNNYAQAKIELHYHPAEEQALQKKQVLSEIHDFCAHEGIQLFVKLVLYHLPGKKMNTTQFQEVQLEVLAELQRFGDVFALQYPQNALAAATLTSELDKPWVLSSDSLGYEEFKDFLRVSLDNGAVGFLADQVLWAGIESLRQEDTSPDLKAITQFIDSKVRDRVVELTRIAQEEFSAP